MLIEGKSSLYPESLHYHERNAIRERIVFVLMQLKVLPAFLEQSFVYLHKLHGRARQQSISNFHGFRVVPATVEISDDFVKHILRGDQRWQPFLQTAPMFHRGPMILIIR